MAQEMRTGFSTPVHEVTQVGELTASPLSEKLQAIGQHILSNGRLVEVEENVFSTCQEPIEKLADRLMRARDNHIPLVEATIFPHTDKYAAVRQLFGITKGLARNLLRSDGIEHHDALRGNNIEYEDVFLLTDADSAVALGGYTGLEVQSSLASSNFRIGDGRMSTGYNYEHPLAFGLMPPNHSGINAALDRISEDFEIAIMRDGSIEGSAVDEIPASRRIQA